MVGNGVIVCQESSTWSQPSIYCKRKLYIMLWLTLPSIFSVTLRLF